MQPLTTKAAEDYSFTVTYYQIEDSYNTVSTYSYTGNSKVVCIANLGALYEGGFHQSAGVNYYFYTLSSDGSTAVLADIGRTSFQTIDRNTGETKTENLPYSEKRYNGVFSYGTVRNYYYGGYYPTFIVNGNVPLISYYQTTYDKNGTLTQNLAPDILAFYYLKTGRLHGGGQPSLTSWNSRALHYNFMTYQNYYLHGTFSFFNPKLENGFFSYEGSVFDGESVSKSGVFVEVTYKGSTKFNYQYYFPLTGTKIGLNLADVQTWRNNDLLSITFVPFVQMTVDGRFYYGSSISYTAAQLESNGCFANGGTPFVYGGSVDKTDGGGGSSIQNPADVEDGEHTAEVVPPIKGEPIPEWTEDNTDLGLLGNIFRFIRNISVNVVTFGEGIVERLLKVSAAVAGVAKPIVDKILELSAKVASIPKPIIDEIIKLGSQISLWSVSLGEDLANIGLDFSAEVALLFDKYFIPDETAFRERVQTVNNKFAFIEEIKSLTTNVLQTVGSASGATPPKITINLDMTGKHYSISQPVTVDFSWYAKYKPSIDTILSSIIWFTFLLNMWRRLPDIISGGGMIVHRFTN